MKKLLRILDESIKDNVTGQYSHSRIIALIIGICASIFMWKLVIMGELTIEYFMAYLAYGTGHQTLNKFLDNKDGQRVRDPVVAKPTDDKDPSLKPPKT